MKKPDIKDLAESARGLGDSSFGSGLGIALIMLAVTGGVGLSMALIKWDGHLFDRKGCVELQEVAGRVFKVDTCTGNTQEISMSDKVKSESSERSR